MTDSIDTSQLVRYNGKLPNKAMLWTFVMFAAALFLGSIIIGFGIPMIYIMQFGVQAPAFVEWQIDNMNINTFVALMCMPISFLILYKCSCRLDEYGIVRQGIIVIRHPPQRTGDNAYRFYLTVKGYNQADQLTTQKRCVSHSEWSSATVNGLIQFDK